MAKAQTKDSNSAEAPFSDDPALTPQQALLRSTKGPIATYKELTVGDSSWLHFALFEVYGLLLCQLSGALGLGLRGIFLPKFLKHGGRKLALSRSCTIRQPKRISLGTGVIVDENVVLDVRARGANSGDGNLDIADKSYIGRGTILAAKGGDIKLGEACNIGSNCRLATESKLHIGKSVLVAAYCYIGPGNHQLDESGKPIVSAPMQIKGGVQIGDSAWIGTRSTILDGVTIGANAVVGAHSLVLEDVPEGAVVAGVPAKIIQSSTKKTET